MITLYGHPHSRAFRVMWMLRELGLPFHHVPTGFLDGGTASHDFRRVNPNARVPVLVDGELTLFESLSINLYLARRYDSDLSARDGREDALALQWSFWVANEVEGPLLFAAANMALFPPDDRRADQAALALAKLDRPFAVLDAELAARPWLLGERFTVADLNVAAVMHLVPTCNIDLPAFPFLSQWLGRSLDRPAAAGWRDIAFSIPRPPTENGLLAMFI